MEDYALDVMIGKGPSARSLRLTLRPFTIVGATTRAGRISGPLRDRFGAVYRLDFYADDDLVAIVRRSARILGIEVSDEAAVAIAGRARATPRIVNRLLRRVRDHAEVHGDGRISLASVEEAMGVLEIDALGLDATDRRLLAAIIQKFGGGPVGVAALGAVLAEETRRSRTSTSRSCCGSGSWTGRRRAGLPRTGPAPTWRRWATRSRRAAPSASRRSGRRPARLTGTPAGAPGRPGGRARRGPGCPGGLSSPVPGAARFDVLVPPPADGSTRARLGRLELPARGRGDADLHARRHQRHGQGAPPRRPGGGRRRDHPGQHVPPLPASGPRADRAARRPPSLHGLGSTDPHRLGRLPGRLARRPQRDRRRRGHVPQPPRRVVASLHPGIVDRDPGGARARRRRRLRPAGPARVDGPARRGRRHRADAPLGRAIAGRPPPRGPGPLRRHPGRPRPGPSPRVDRVHRRPPLRRAQHRRPRRRRDGGGARGGPRHRRVRHSTAIRGCAT